MDGLDGYSVPMKIMLVLMLHEIEVGSPCNQGMYAKRKKGLQVYKSWRLVSEWDAM